MMFSTPRIIQTGREKSPGQRMKFPLRNRERKGRELGKPSLALLYGALTPPRTTSAVTEATVQLSRFQELLEASNSFGIDTIVFSSFEFCIAGFKHFFNGLEAEGAAWGVFRTLR